MEVLIVGAGLTGSLIASAISKACNTSKLTVWEKAGWVGGRTLTYRHPTSQLHVDMGAQYISRSTTPPSPNCKYTRLKDNLYEELLSSGVLVPFCGAIDGVNEDLTIAKSIQNYVAPKGFSSIVEHFLAQSRADLFLGYHLSEVSFRANNLHSTPYKSNCKCTRDKSGQFDIVILTMPTPELLEIKGDLFKNKELQSSLSSVSYAPRYALGLFYKENIPITKWSSKYFEADCDDPSGAVIRYASWGTGMKGCEDGSRAGCTLLLHSGVEFATRHQETDGDRVTREMMIKLEKLLPGLPLPSQSHLVNWKYARANRVPIYHDTPGCLVLSLDPMVVATGDGLCDSNFESCVKAAMVTVERVMAHQQWPK